MFKKERKNHYVSLLICLKQFLRTYIIIIILKRYRYIHILMHNGGEFIVLQFKNMQDFTKIGDIDHYSLHNIFIISVIT